MNYAVILLLVVAPFRSFCSGSDNWIADGENCPNDPDQEERCIDRSNCILPKNEHEFAKGYPTVCKHSGRRTPVMCCLTLDFYGGDDSDEDEYPAFYEGPHHHEKPSGHHHHWDSDAGLETETKLGEEKPPGLLLPKTAVRTNSDEEQTVTESPPDVTVGLTEASPDLLSTSNPIVSQPMQSTSTIPDIVVTTNAPDPQNVSQNTSVSDRTTGGTAQTDAGNSSSSTAQAVRIPTPYVRPSFQNSTFLRKCGEYFRQVPLLKGKHTPIVGGRPARGKEFPHLALLGYGQPSDIQWQCGGSLISDQYVLTAAHCIIARRLGQVRYVRLGELDISSTTDDADVKDFTVQSIITHPLYRSLTSYHDIALIRLNATVSFNSYIRPACLATKLLDLDKAILVAAGWGLLENGGAMATTLQRATLKYVPQERCSRIYGTPRNIMQGIVEDVHICADGGSERKDSCQGDSGGPLQYTNYEYEEPGLLGFVEVVGITSFGKVCGLTAGVYTRVLPYVPWIESIVWPNEVA